MRPSALILNAADDDEEDDDDDDECEFECSLMTPPVDDEPLYDVDDGRSVLVWMRPRRTGPDDEEEEEEEFDGLAKKFADDMCDRGARCRHRTEPKLRPACMPTHVATDVS